MEHFDFAARLRSALVAQGRPVTKGTDGTHKFRCVRHDDTHPSAWIGDRQWGCFACGFTESLDTLGDVLGIAPPPRGLTLEDYAASKGFRVDLLRKWGLETVRGKYGDEVHIPYLDADGKTLRAQIRTDRKSFWGEGEGTYLYGLSALAKAPMTMPVLLVEGASDCHAAWHVGILAIGVPGANGWKRDWSPVFAGRTVYVWQEPDEAGAKLIQAVRQSLPDARVIQHPDAKDVADLYRADPAGCKATLRRLMTEAVGPSAPLPRVPFVRVSGPVLDALLTRKLAPVDAVPTMFAAWNRECRDEGGQVGPARGWHVTVGAKTGAGKSLLALNLAARAVRAGERVAFVSLEMSDAQLMTRFLAILSGEPVASLEEGPQLSPMAFRRAQAAIEEVEERTGGALFINQQPIVDLGDIVEAVRFQVGEHGCRYVVTDYLQLARVVGKRELLETVTEVSGTLRGLARELNAVSVGLSQFNRQTSAANEKPTPQGLMGGSPLENDSDQVVLLDHTVYSVNRLMGTARTQLLLAKNRHGPCTEILFDWDYRTLRAYETAEEGVATEALAESEEDRGEAWEAPPERALALL